MGAFHSLSLGFKVTVAQNYVSTVPYVLSD
jgi:hypothetical protein